MTVHLFRSIRMNIVVVLYILSFTVARHIGAMSQVKDTLCLDIFGCVDIINFWQRFKYFTALKNKCKWVVSEEKLK